MFSPGGGGHVSIHWEMRVLKVTSLRKVSYWRNVDAIEWRWYRAMLKLTRGGFVLVDMFQSYGSLGGVCFYSLGNVVHCKSLHLGRLDVLVIFTVNQQLVTSLEGRGISECL